MLHETSSPPAHHAIDLDAGYPVKSSKCVTYVLHCENIPSAWRVFVNCEGLHVLNSLAESRLDIFPMMLRLRILQLKRPDLRCLKAETQDSIATTCELECPVLPAASRASLFASPPNLQVEANQLLQSARTARTQEKPRVCDQQQMRPMHRARPQYCAGGPEDKTRTFSRTIRSPSSGKSESSHLTSQEWAQSAPTNTARNICHCSAVLSSAGSNLLVGPGVHSHYRVIPNDSESDSIPRGPGIPESKPFRMV